MNLKLRLEQSEQDRDGLINQIADLKAENRKLLHADLKCEEAVKAVKSMRSAKRKATRKATRKLRDIRKIALSIIKEGQ